MFLEWDDAEQVTAESLQPQRLFNSAPRWLKSFDMTRTCIIVFISFPNFHFDSILKCRTFFFFFFTLKCFLLRALVRLDHLLEVTCERVQPSRDAHNLSSRTNLACVISLQLCYYYHFMITLFSIIVYFTVADVVVVSIGTQTLTMFWSLVFYCWNNIDLSLAEK